MDLPPPEEVDRIYGLPRALQDEVRVDTWIVPFSSFSDLDPKFWDEGAPARWIEEGIRYSATTPESRARAKERMETLLARVYPMDVAAIRASLRGESQSTMAARWGITQPAVSVRMAGATARMVDAVTLPDLHPEDLRVEILGHVPDVWPSDRAEQASRIGAAAYWCLSSSVIGRICGRSQGWAYHYAAHAVSVLPPGHPAHRLMPATKMTVWSHRDPSAPGMTRGGAARWAQVRDVLAPLVVEG